MNRFSFLLRCLAVSLGIWWGLGITVCHAVSFTVTVDTTPLATQTTPPAPFSLEFQMVDGDGTVNNTATLGDFQFGAGGAAVGAPATTGGASGNLSGTVTLSDSSFFNEFIQGFTPSATDPLSFLLDISENVEAGTPDAFSFAIFDSSGTGIPTSFFDVFVQIDITSPLTINTYASDTSVSPPGCPTCPPITLSAPTVDLATTPVPEPGALLLLVSGVVGVILSQRRRRV